MHDCIEKLIFLKGIKERYDLKLKFLPIHPTSSHFIFQSAKATFSTFVLHFILLKQIRRVAMEAQKDPPPLFTFFWPQRRRRRRERGRASKTILHHRQTGLGRRRKERKKSVPNCPSWQGETQGGKAGGAFNHGYI